MIMPDQSSNSIVNLKETKMLRSAKLPIFNMTKSIINNSSQRIYVRTATQKLLRFPAFPLKETIDRYIKTAEPFLSKEEQKDNIECAKDFEQNEGAALQKLLEAAAEKDKNWLAGRWLSTAYLKYREPVTITSSPGMAFPLVEFKDLDDFRMYTAKVIYSYVQYKKLIDDGKIPVVKMGENELDNSQFMKVLGTNRNPKPFEDELEFNPCSKHIVIIYKNHFFKLPVYNEDDCPFSADTIAEELCKIMNSVEEKGPEIGVLTTANRDLWSEAFEILCKDPKNKKSLEVIQKSLFTVSLDEPVKVKNPKEKIIIQCGQLIHGGGAVSNAANRWMDKTIQVVVNPSGFAGLTYEHSPAEGQPIALMTDAMFKNLKNPEYFSGGAQGPICSEKLEFVEDECISPLIVQAKLDIDAKACDILFQVIHYDKYGKEFLKQEKLSPDSFVQMAIQYAFYKMYKKPGAQYESAHLRIYDGGRTETIRSCSNETVELCKAILDSDKNDVERAKLLRKAVDNHRNYTKLALQGRGVDRHLLGLRLMAEENKLPIPKFYSSPGFVRSSNYRLSTSQVASAFDAFMCYGPLTYDGYACCYNPRKCDIILAVSCWDTNPDTNLSDFAAALTEGFNAMEQILINARMQGGGPKSKL